MGRSTPTTAFAVGHPEPEKNSVGIFEYISASMLKVYFDVFKKELMNYSNTLPIQ